MTVLNGICRRVVQNCRGAAWASRREVSQRPSCDIGPASVRACLVLVGGFLQALLVAASWAVRRGSKERAAIAASYAALAAYATGLAAGKLDAPSPAPLPAGAALEDTNPLLPPATRLKFVDLLEQAERVRASLAALAAEAADIAGRDGDEFRSLLGDAATALSLIADALAAPRAGRLSPLRDLRNRLIRRSVTPAAHWRWAGEALLGQLRATGRMIADLDAVRPQELAEPPASARPLARSDVGLASLIIAMRTNLALTSDAGRHALRLAVAAALAEAIVQATGLYQGRWATLTVFLVLKPDYASTLYRGAQRAVGTAVGAGLGAAAEIAHPGAGGQLVAAGLCVAAAYALFDVSYLLFSVFLTVFIVVLLQLLGISAVATAEARFFATFIGAALGLVAYLAWPTWQGTTAQEKFALLLEAHRDYAIELLRALGRPASVEWSRLRALQAAARRSRSDAETATTRLSDEPAHAALTPETAQAVIAAVARLTRAELALHALALPPHRAGEQAGLPDAIVAERIDALASALDAAMTGLASALRRLVRPNPIPALRTIHVQLRSAAAVDESAVVGLTDRLIDSVDTVDAILRERLPVAPGG